MANMKRTTIMLPADMYQRLSQLKNQTGVSVGAHVRLALAQYLNHPLYGGPEGGGP